MKARKQGAVMAQSYLCAAAAAAAPAAVVVGSKTRSQLLLWKVLPTHGIPRPSWTRLGYLGAAVPRLSLHRSQQLRSLGEEEWNEARNHPLGSHVPHKDHGDGHPALREQWPA